MVTSQFIHDMRTLGHNVLVHCMAGRSRSASIILAYLMSKLDMTSADALKYVLKSRVIVNPNKQFKNDLKRFDKLKSFTNGEFNVETTNLSTEEVEAILKSKLKKFADVNDIETIVKMLLNNRDLMPDELFVPDSESGKGYSLSNPVDVDIDLNMFSDFEKKFNALQLDDLSNSEDIDIFKPRVKSEDDEMVEDDSGSNSEQSPKSSLKRANGKKQHSK